MKTDLKQIEQDVLVALSDFIPHNQNQIADLIGKSHQKSTNRVNVSRSLKNLTLYLKRTKNEIDESGKIWVMKPGIQTIKQIVENYPIILPHFQKNDRILAMLVEKHFWLINYKRLAKKSRATLPTIECKSCIKNKQKPCPIDSEFEPQTCRKVPNEELYEKEIILRQNKLTETFKNHLCWSPSFFEMCLKNTPQQLKMKTDEIYNLTSDRQQGKKRTSSINGWLDIDSIDNGLSVYLDRIFETCVFHDILIGVATNEAKKLLLGQNKHTANKIAEYESRFFQSGENSGIMLAIYTLAKKYGLDYEAEKKEIVETVLASRQQEIGNPSK